MNWRTLWKRDGGAPSGAPSGMPRRAGGSPPGLPGALGRIFASPSLPDPDDPSALCLRPPGGWGDHLMLSAVIEGIRAEQPDLRIFVAANHPEIFRHNPHVAGVFHKRWLKRHAGSRYERWVETAYRTPGERRAEETAGHAARHLIDDMYARAGVRLARYPRQPRIYLTGAEKDASERRTRPLPGPRVAIVPHGKRDRWWPNKVYPQEQWERLVRLLPGAPPGWPPGPAGSVLQLGARADGPLLPGAVDCRGLGYRRTAALLRACDLLVTHVGGLMHLAAAVGTPAVVLYGAVEDPAVSGYPWNRNLYVPVDCGPCWMQAPCAHHTCMRALEPERIAAEVGLALSGAGPEEFQDLRPVEHLIGLDTPRAAGTTRTRRLPAARGAPGAPPAPQPFPGIRRPGWVPGG